MKIAVIGAGAAGLLASGTAALQGNSVYLFEKNEKPGKKIYITGKGRCNVTNLCSPQDFLSNVVGGKKFLTGAIYSFTPEMLVELINQNGVATKVERGNRVFPLSDKSSDIIKALERYAVSAGARLIYEKVNKIVKNEDEFTVSTDCADYTFDKVILACGGVSYPLTGSTGDGYEFARRFGHTVTKLRPALAPVLLKQNVKGLEGLSLKNVNVSVTVAGKTFSEFGEMLFTANGVSGPVVLTLSSLINSYDLKTAKLSVDFKPALDEIKLDKRVLSDFEKFKNKQYKNSLSELMPQKLIDYFIEYTKIYPDKQVNSITKAERARIVDALKNMTFDVLGLDDIKRGIVTAGGVSTAEINPKTMESKLVSGLYFAGEMMDVDAFTGGFNLQIAFSTGYVAGKHAGGDL